MDPNTATVLNSVLDIISIIVTGIMVVYVARNNKKVDAVKSDVSTVNSKVEEYHKEVNGKMGLLLETTKQLATANEKARSEKEDLKNKIITPPTSA